ncbi:uncharacterized protein LOC128533600 isoform X1 [Clarias gariepinus]|uniref:uncharacterized protein LOC128533600 isoform X1 n=1 Tax=Clarias gariepinus TaxID=13013 RepID=UPI00234C2A0C|nr:uncharacterized protein LOC128533600 isoform X1 [Clarias gariepinus]
MCVKYFIQLLAFFSVLVSNGLTCSESCMNTILHIRPGSEVLLPCTLLNSSKTEEASWRQSSRLLIIRPNGNVTFEDPRDGRLTVFPYLFGRGNFSILVHQFQASDVGTYCCELSHECQRVELTLSQSSGLHIPWYYFAAGGGILILLVFVFVLICKFRVKCIKRSSSSYYVNSENKEQQEAKQTQRAESAKVDDCDGEYENIESDTHEADYENALEEEPDGKGEDTASDNQDEDYVNTERRNSPDLYDDVDSAFSTGLNLERDMRGHHNNKSVYENDEHDPNQKSKIPPKAAIRKLPKQQSKSGLYYANQAQIHNTGYAGNKDKEYQFKNPLYDQHISTKPKQ